jgi:transcription elongation factor GreA
MHERMTCGDVAKLQEELDHRKLVIRHQILDELKEAKAQGDLSENFEYHAAKQARGKNESRIRYLQGMINTAVIVDDGAAQKEAGLVSMDRPVRIYIPEDDEEQDIRIVTSIRGNSMKGLISIESPLGKALLHHREGDTVRVKISDGYSYDVVIRQVGDTVDEADDAIKGF